MTDICPITYAKRRVEERGYKDFRMVFRELQLQPNESRTINAYNELWFVLSAEDGIRVVSDYGVYDYGQPLLSEQFHEHADRIELLNKGASTQKIRFLQIIMGGNATDN